jgi:NAD(P)-dependent dehydrogenase (short-subunit alcohol dehydrogenase family)
MGRALRAELAVHDTTAGVAYFGFIDTEMVRVAFEDPAAAQARQTVPAWVTRPLPVGRAGAAVVRGIERRSVRVTAPRWIPAVLASRGVLALLDSRVGHDRRTREAVQIAERAREP